VSPLGLYHFGGHECAFEPGAPVNGRPAGALISMLEVRALRHRRHSSVWSQRRYCVKKYVESSVD